MIVQWAVRLPKNFLTTPGLLINGNPLPDLLFRHFGEGHGEYTVLHGSLDALGLKKNVSASIAEYEELTVPSSHQVLEWYE